MQLLAELKRRNVIRMAGLYLVGAWLVIQIAETLLPIFHTPDWVLQALVVLLAIGFIPALVFSWIFELTPEGLKRDDQVKPGESVATETGRRMDQLTLAGVLVLLAVIAADRYWPRADAPEIPETARSQGGADRGVDVQAGAILQAEDPVATRQGRSIAVLPFANRSAEPDTQYFVDGVHDDLITQLSKVAALRVTSRTSVNEYRDTEKKIPQIAAELGVATVLEGAVQRAGNRVRITAQLIRAADDSHLWAETFDRELTAENLFDIQSEIAGKIAGALQTTLSPAESAAVQKVLTKNLVALEAYRRARILLWSVIQTDLTEPERWLAIALAEDPDFAAAYAMQARIEIANHWFRGADSDALRRADLALTKARTLDPDAVEVLLSEGYFHYWGYRDYAKALESIDRALVIAPGDADIQGLRAFVLRRMGRFDEARAGLRDAVLADPLNLTYRTDLALMELRNGRAGAAREALEAALAIDPGFAYAHLNLALLDVELGGDLASARTRMAKHISDASIAQILGWWLAVAQGDTALALKLSTIGSDADSQTLQMYLHPAMFRGLALWAAKDIPAARVQFELARGELQADLDARPDQPRRLLALCVVLSGLEETEKAAPVCAEADRLQAPDAWSAATQFRDLAPLLGGDLDGALQKIEQSLSRPAGGLPLRYDLSPLYARLHDQPRFIAAMQRYREFVSESP